MIWIIFQPFSGSFLPFVTNDQQVVMLQTFGYLSRGYLQSYLRQTDIWFKLCPVCFARSAQKYRIVRLLVYCRKIPSRPIFNVLP